jgi:hypothetical protein
MWHQTDSRNHTSEPKREQATIIVDVNGSQCKYLLSFVCGGGF